MADRLDRALGVLLNSLESAAGRQESYEAGSFGAMAQRLNSGQMFLGTAGGWRSCKSATAFDTLKRRLGAIWWPPTFDQNGELLPLICGASRKDDSFTIRLGIVRPTSDGDFEGVGVRFETGHHDAEGEGGRHDFHHAQLFSQAAKGVDASRLTREGQWLPEEQPSIPIVAANPLELVWATAVSTYGRREARAPFDSLRGEDQEDFDAYLAGLQ